MTAGEGGYVPPTSSRLRPSSLAHRNLYVWGSALPVLQSLVDAAIPLIVLKGLPQMEDLYGGIDARPSTDVDILIHAGDLPRTVAVILGSGARLAAPLPEERAEAYASVPWQFTVDPAGQVMLDLHTDAISRLRKPSLDPEVWRRAAPRTMDGLPFLVLSPEDRLLLLAWDYVADGLIPERLVDIERAVARGDIDWGVLRQRSAELGLSRVLDWSLRDVDAREARIPAAALPQRTPAVGVRPLIFRRLAHRRVPWESPTNIIRRACAYDRWSDTLRTLGRSLAPSPTELGLVLGRAPSTGEYSTLFAVRYARQALASLRALGRLPRGRG